MIVDNTGFERIVADAINNRAKELEISPKKIEEDLGISKSNYSGIINYRRANRWFPKVIIRLLNYLGLKLRIEKVVKS